MTQPKPAIRRAGAADAAALADIGARTFTATFGHMYPPQDLADFLAASHSRARVAADLADPRAAAWLVEAGDEVIGYASVGPASLPHPDVTPQCGELRRLYLLPGRQGGGLGTRLLLTTLAWLERDGPRAIWLSAWSQNHGAQRLYARHGFEKVGEYLYPVGASRDEEFILRRPPARAILAAN